ncbi:MAG: DNA cytosine methyltransferase [Gammaproteobacteria bacterium]|nr:DNA cytosine methyltransferase [Gammaproteobacteria bacterium]
MPQSTPIPIVDLFAGPGGLGEGFSSIDNGKAFKTIVSAEMEASAHSTLRLRAFYRILRGKGKNALKSYYRYCNEGTSAPYDAETLSDWEEAGREARQITLGSETGNDELNAILDKANIGPTNPWVLIGGPPCQAYSLVGRSRNLGKADYVPEKDHRHYLYQEYLRIIHRYKPAVFVMENVKGILSSKINKQHIFHTILQDLVDPDRVFGKSSGCGYRIHALTNSTVFDSNSNVEDIDARDFLVRTEEYGIPQARHRVILLGIRGDIDATPDQLKKQGLQSFDSATHNLPHLRSKLTKEADSPEKWADTVNHHLMELALESSRNKALEELSTTLKKYEGTISSKLGTGSLREPMSYRLMENKTKLDEWYEDSELKVWLNHETRGHMTSDLRRYVYAAAFAEAFDHSPKGHDEFSLAGLHPNHANWKTGKFSDRFRVQLKHIPATTVTSHISKDGHYFIHPDPSQCRSLTVREAARLQTFPDNYFFQGNRTQQLHQVGNAVPPLLSKYIAAITARIFQGRHKF